MNSNLPFQNQIFCILWDLDFWKFIFSEVIPNWHPKKIIFSQIFGVVSRDEFGFLRKFFFWLWDPWFFKVEQYAFKNRFLEKFFLYVSPSKILYFKSVWQNPSVKFDLVYHVLFRLPLIIIKNFLGFYISITAWQEYVEKFNDTTLVIDVAKDSVQTFSNSYFIFMQL